MVTMTPFEPRTMLNYQEPLSPWDAPRWAIGFSGSVPAKTTRTLDIGGVDEVVAEHQLVANVPESELVPFLIRSLSTRNLIADALGLPFGDAWFWIHEQRANLLPENTYGLPGDFDIICGVCRDGRPSFEFLCAIEVKRRRVASSGKAKSFPSGDGIDQAMALAELGFDRTLLAHCLVSERTARDPTGSTSMQGLLNAQNGLAAEATANRISARQTSFGQLLLSIGQGPNRDFRNSHAVIANLPRVPPTLPRQDSSLVQSDRALLVRSVAERIGSLRTGRHFSSTRGGRILDLEVD